MGLFNTLQSERLKGGLNRSQSSHGRLAQHLAAKQVAAAVTAAPATGSEAPAAVEAGQPTPPQQQQPAVPTPQPKAGSPASPGGNSNMPANAKCPKLDKGDNRGKSVRNSVRFKSKDDVKVCPRFLI